MLAHALAFAALLPLLACRPAAPAPSEPAIHSPMSDSIDVVLQTRDSIYRPGAQIDFTLTNQGAITYAFNPCVRTLERRLGDAWRAVKEERVCTMEAWILAAGRSRSATTDLPGELPAGEYRLALPLTREGGEPGTGTRLTVFSPAFAVRR